ncbi:MAG: SIMPL domain-containing protein [Candidatus Pacebacteria bacterium]|nr:SIMPL domain-containing protein [Candidatus Paceibacterota bacterium]
MQPTRPLLLSVLMIALGISLGVLGVTVLSKYVGPLPLSITQTTTQKQSTFDVTGESKVTTIPDKAMVNLGITIQEQTVKLAQDKANTVINNINAELGKLGIQKKDIRTENYSLYPTYDYREGQKITGYNVNASISVSLTDFSILNQAIDAATKVGANQVGGISFTLSDEKKKEVENDARKQAIDDAKTKAQTLSQLAGMRLGKIVNVSEQPNYNGGPYPVAMMEKAGGGMGGGAPTTVEPGSTTFNYSVTISYETF